MPAGIGTAFVSLAALTTASALALTFVLPGGGGGGQFLAVVAAVLLTQGWIPVARALARCGVHSRDTFRSEADGRGG